MLHIDFTALPPPESWTATIRDHLDALQPPVTARDVRLLETAATGRVSIIHDDRMRVCALLDGARNAYGKVTIAGQTELIRQVRARVAG